jgi:hypothetical protein
MAYESVNGAWPEGTNDGRDIVPTPQEALAGARRLYRKAFGRPFKGKMKLTSGRRYTYIRCGIFYVNPNQNGDGGWHEIVHGISHYATARLHPRAPGHGAQHAWIERELISYVVQSGWLDGKLRRPEKAKPDPISQRHERVLAGIRRWEQKKRRAENALKKLARQRRYYERPTTAQTGA